MKRFVPLIVLLVLSGTNSTYLRAINCLDGNKCAVEIVDGNDDKLPREYPNEERCSELCKTLMRGNLKKLGEGDIPRLLLIIKTDGRHEKRNLDIRNSVKARRIYNGDMKPKKSEGSNESSGDRNPDNPHTTYKNKYLQNSMWNFQMTGDHLNLHPKAPLLGSMEPSPVKLFRGRKWWYFNQDDYLPMN